MSDLELRALERASKTGDPAAIRAWRVALVRAGRGAEAGFREGDTVLVVEEHSCSICAETPPVTEHGCPADDGLGGKRTVVVSYEPRTRQLMVRHEDDLPEKKRDADGLESTSTRVTVIDLSPSSGDSPDGRADPPVVELLAVGDGSDEDRRSTMRPMTPLEARAATALGRAKFSPGTSAKRIAQTLAAQVEPNRISEPQARVLWKLVWSYRKSIPFEIVQIARFEIEKAQVAK